MISNLTPLLVIRLFAIFLPLAVGHAATTYRLAQDFSMATNPNGVWSYGYAPQPGAFTLMATPLVEEHSSIPIWSWSEDGQSSPRVYFNASSTEIYSAGGGSFPPGSLWVLPGPETSSNAFAVLRFTAPSNGRYRVTTRAASYLDENSGDAEYRIATNGMEVVGVSLAPGAQLVTTSNQFALAQGGVIDFIVGRGRDGLLEQTGLKLDAQITHLGNGTTNPPPTTGTNGIPAPSGVVAWWPFEGNGNDVSGRSHSVQLFGSPSFPPGKVGQALAVDGVNDYGRVEPHPDLDLGANDGLTLEMWINPQSTAVQQPLLEWSDNHDIVGLHFWISVPSAGGGVGSLWANVMDRNGSAHHVSSPPGVVLPNTFTHVAMSYSKASGVARLFANGQVVASKHIGSVIPETRHALYVGWRPIGGEWRYTGRLDEITLYNRELSGNEVDAIFRAGAAGKTNGTPPVSPFPNFDLSRNFALSNNPSGVWSYGWKSNFTAPLALLSSVRTFGADNGVPIRAWEPTTFQIPVVGKVLGPDTAVSDGGRFTAPAGTVFFSPGPDDSPRNFGVVRFTAPSNGNYHVAVSVQQLFDGTRSRDSDFHLLRNGVQLFGAFLAPHGETNYQTTVPLAGGGTLEFLVGRGADGTTTDSGLKIEAVVTPGGGSTNPPAAVAPVILAQPQSQTVMAGSSVRFSVQATGTAPLFYGWRINGTNLTWTGSSLTISNVQSYHAGAYSVVVTNIAGSAISSNAFLTVITSTNPPVSDAGFDISDNFSISNNPSGAWSYGWKEAIGGTLGLATQRIFPVADNGVPVMGWIPTNAALPAIYFNHSLNTAIIGGGQGVLPSGTVWFHPGLQGAAEKYAAVRFTAPSNGNYRIETAVAPVYSGSLSGDTDFHVAKDGAELFGEFLSPSGSAGYTNVLALDAGGTVDFVLGPGADGNPYGAAMRIAAVITPTTNAPVVLAPVIVTQPQDQTVIAGSTATFTVTATGTAPLTYQWRINGTNIGSSAGPSLTLSNAQSYHAGIYSVVITNIAGVAISSNAVLTVITSTNPSVSEAGFNLSAEFSISNNPSGAWSYGWKETVEGTFGLVTQKISPVADNGVPVMGWVLTNGVLPAIYLNNSLNTAIIGGGQGVLPSGTVWFHPGFQGVTEKYAAIRFTAPSNGHYRIETAVAPVYSGSLSGDTDFHVTKDGTELFGVFLTPTENSGYTNEVSLDAGQTIDFVLGPGADANPFGAALKIAAAITPVANGSTNPPVAVAPGIVTQPQDQTVVAGGTATFTVTATGTAPLFYRWRINGTNLTSTGSSLTISNVQSYHAGAYSVIITNIAGITISSNAVLSVVSNGPFALASPKVMAAGFEFAIAASAGTRLVVEASDDLIHWTHVSSLVCTNAHARFADPEALVKPRRFYRVRLRASSDSIPSFINQSPQ